MPFAVLIQIALLFLVLPFPFGTDQRRRRVPWVTYTLIGANVLVYLLTHPDAPTGHAVGLYAHWGLAPTSPVLYTFLTYMFLHVSLEHLFWNMMFLWLFGPHVEEALGHVTFTALYIGGGIAAGLLHMAIVLIFAARYGIPVAPLVGASGAISAILAPYAVRFHRSQIQMVWLPGFLFRSWGRLELPAVAGLGLWLLQTVVGALKTLIVPGSGGIAYWAHIGGFVFGLLTAELTGLLRDAHQQYLLDDARAEAVRGPDYRPLALQKYQTYLNQDSGNVTVRTERARLLAQRAGGEPEEIVARRQEAAQEYLFLVRDLLKAGRLDEALASLKETIAQELPLPLTARERLRLGNASEDAGKTEMAISQFRALISDFPESPEGEMARFKLGQHLLSTNPQEAVQVLTVFLERYPDSPWARRVMELRTEALQRVGMTE